MRHVAILAVGLALSCEDGAVEDPREAQIVNVMAQADESVIRNAGGLIFGAHEHDGVMKAAAKIVLGEQRGGKVSP